MKEFTLPKIEVFSIIHILLIDTLKKMSGEQCIKKYEY